jgi:deazaflavin-dependent oxidoreductase (nitroreductase family)
MALPRWLGRFNLVVTNRISGLVAGWLPLFGIVEHVGRRSGEVRRTPINVFRRRSGAYVVALTYGADTNWVRNVLAAGGCRLRTRGRWGTLVKPRRFRDPSRRSVPWFVRPVLWLIRVDWFLELRPVSVREDARRN